MKAAAQVNLALMRGLGGGNVHRKAIDHRPVAGNPKPR
jgi:hypothetical protein